MAKAPPRTIPTVRAVNAAKYAEMALTLILLTPRCFDAERMLDPQTGGVVERFSKELSDYTGMEILLSSWPT